MLAMRWGATFFRLQRGAKDVVGWKNPVNRSGKRSWRIALCVGAAVALMAMALVLPALIGSSDTVAEKHRYTSICTKCGVQMAEDFYVLLGTELLRSQKVLGTSKLTRITGNDRCAHETAFIGRSMWQIHKTLGIGESASGQPGGWIYDGKELPNHLAALATMRPSESLRYMEELRTGRR